MSASPNPSDVDAASVRTGDDGRAETTIGVTGQPWRASVSPWGAVTPWSADTDGAAWRTLDWFVAADDRWHVPAQETAVRQRRVDGAPVIETRVRIPDGDVVQRIWSVADRGGVTVVEFENDSPLPVAVALAGSDVLTERAPADVPVQGIELPEDTIVLPLGHHATIRVGVAHTPLPDGVDPHNVSLRSLPDATTVARGWRSVVDRASRLGIPDVALADAVVAARADLLLDGPGDAVDDPLGFVLDVVEIVRCGDDAAPWLPEIVGPLESAVRSGDPVVGAALRGARHVALAAGDERAAGDIDRIRRRLAGELADVPLGPFSEVRRGRSTGRFVHAVEARLVAPDDAGARLLPMGIPPSWIGADFELHGVPTSADSTVSFAVRWHGERPAVLWEQTGTAVTLSAPAIDDSWSTDTAAGEALWPAPRTVPATRLAVTPDATRPVTRPATPDTGPPGSFT